MKNKKIIALTIAIVAVVLVGVLGLSRFFETSWQNENTVDNSLSADIVDNSESVFNYPFTTYEEIKNGGQTDWFTENRYVNNLNLPIPDDALPYQTIANIAGDAITYSTGLTNHQKITAYISGSVAHIGHTYGKTDAVATFHTGFEFTYSTDSNGKDVNVYKYETYNELKDTPKGKATDTIITVLLDMYTGEIYDLQISYNNEFLNPDEKFAYKLPFGCSYVDGQIEKELLSSTLEIIKLFGCREQFKRYCVLEFEGVYQVIIESSYGKVKYLEFLKENNNYMFANYTDAKHHYSPYNFEFKDISD